MQKKRSARLLAGLLLALTIWGTTAYGTVHHWAVPSQQLVADPGGSGTGNGG